MSCQELQRFVDDVVRFHELATGLKSLNSHEQIIALGQQSGYVFSEDDWQEMFEKDLSAQVSSVRQSVETANPEHWSWAFRQLSVWRGMLMAGAED
tara:strand:- start:3802 stop:4089 length:288 start_codon:yes stop_codon:yes gene_type:complete